MLLHWVSWSAPASATRALAIRGFLSWHPSPSWMKIPQLGRLCLPTLEKQFLQPTPSSFSVGVHSERCPCRCLTEVLKREGPQKRRHAGHRQPSRVTSSSRSTACTSTKCSKEPPGTALAQRAHRLLGVLRLWVWQRQFPAVAWGCRVRGLTWIDHTIAYCLASTQLELARGGMILSPKQSWTSIATWREDDLAERLPVFTACAYSTGRAK